MSASVTVNLEAGGSRGVGCVDRRGTCDRDGLGEVGFRISGVCPAL